MTSKYALGAKLNQETNTLEAGIEPRDLRRPEVSESMAKAVASLCAVKIEMDRFARDPMGQPCLDDWMDSPRRDTCAYHGDTFLALILPFMGWAPDKTEKYHRAYVAPQFVLGASIKGKPEDVLAKEVVARIETYANDFEGQNRAEYLRYPALGLFVAHEGKHRVAFMRAHEQPTIAAWVRDAQYPAAERINIIAPTDSRDEWLALLDQRYLQVLRRPNLTQGLLNAYGVSTLRWRDLPGLPDEHRVREVIYARKLHRQPKSLAKEDRTLDLDEVKRQVIADEILVERDIHELAPLKLLWRPYFGTAAAGMTAGTGLSAFGFGHPAQTFGWMLTGGAIGLFAALLLMRFRGPKRALLGW